MSLLGFPAGLAAAKSTGYQIGQSLRFNSGDSHYLNRTPSSKGNATTWTWSGWLKLGATSNTYNKLFHAYYGNSSRYFILQFVRNGSYDYLQAVGGLYSTSATSEIINLQTTQKFRDLSAWYHIVFAYDSGNATSSDRCKLYINGTRVTAFGTATYPSQNNETFVNQSTTPHYLGSSASSECLDGYLAEVNFIDGSALAPTDFGKEDDNGVWIPKRYTGSYTGQSWYLRFASGDGTDSSGLSNTWTANNFTTSGTGTDVMSDTPTTNWCTLNPLSLHRSTLNDTNDGNLGIECVGGTWDRGTKGTIGVDSGKWYWEYTHGTIASGYPTADIGITKYESTIDATYHGGSASTESYMIQGNNGNKYNNGGSSYGSAFTTGDVCSIALDMDNGKVWFGKNGTWFNSGDPAAGTNEAFSGLSGTFWPLFYWGLSAGTSGINQAYFNFGQRAFAYTPPTGFKALNTSNLPAPTVKDGSKHFNTLLYTGTGGTKVVSGAGFQPDFVWIKNRGRTNSSHVLVDAVRGATKALSSDSTGTEVTTNGTDDFRSFDSDGFTVGDSSNYFVNSIGDTHVAWNWDAGGSTSSNTDGSITSTVSANPTAGFSIVAYQSSTTTKPLNVGHGLGVKPSFILTKNRDATASWGGYHSALGATKGIFINSTSAAITSTDYWNNTEPTSTVFTVFDSNNTHSYGTTNNFIAYCFAEVEGYSKIGSYTGSGLTDGPFVYCGFRPAWILIKRIDSSSDWILQDSKRLGYNVDNNDLIPNQNYAEATDDRLDQLSNGFKLRSTFTTTNAWDVTYIFVALAENPFGGSGVSPATAR